jgi:hypothetical protein
MSNNELMCWHHPNRKATQISNLGTVLDLDTLVCDRCAARILADKNQNQPINPNATVRPISDTERNDYGTHGRSIPE